MNEKSDLEKYAEFALSGPPQIKADEKRYWLGEFRERIVFALSFEQIEVREALKLVEEKLQDSRIDQVIIHSGVRDSISEKYLELAHQYQKDYKQVDLQNPKQEIALVLASKEAVNEENVMTDHIPLLPKQFYNASGRKLCTKHMEELRKEAPRFVDEFEEIGFLDKIMGIRCGVCSQKLNE